MRTLQALVMYSIFWMRSHEMSISITYFSTDADAEPSTHVRSIDSSLHISQRLLAYTTRDLCRVATTTVAVSAVNHHAARIATYVVMSCYQRRFNDRHL